MSVRPRSRENFFWQVSDRKRGVRRRGKRRSEVAAGTRESDGTVTDGPYPETKEVLGGFAVVDVPSREEALEWAAKIAVACRCAQEVRELMPDPDV